MNQPNPVDCYSCGKQLATDETPDKDDDGNWYHPDCAERLRSKWDDDRQEDIARDMSAEYDNLASAEGDYLRKTGYTLD